MLYPEHIRTVGIISPAGRLGRELFDSGLAVLRREGLRVKLPGRLQSVSGGSYLAGTPEERAADFMQLYLDEEVDLLLCVRGGFGSAQILPLLDWEALKQRKIPVAGYSDITALHWAMDRFETGIPAVSPMLGKLSGLDTVSSAAMFEMFSGRERSAPVREISGGAFSGRVLAGNLTVAASLAGSCFFPDGSGRVIFLEDINEPVYKIDRCLTQLEQAGLFRNAAGVVFGSFSGSDPQELKDLLHRFAGRCRLPAAAGFPFGHNFPLMSFSFAENAVFQDGNVHLKG